MRKRSQGRSVVSIAVGLAVFLAGMAALALLNVCLFLVSIADYVLSRIERWINERFETLYGGW